MYGHNVILLAQNTAIFSSHRMRLQRVFCLFLSLVLTLGHVRYSLAENVQIRRAHAIRPLVLNGQTVHRLLGDVVLLHDSATMRCDSAYLFQENNMFRAYGHVQIRSKNIRIRGDSLYYEGESGTGRIFGKNVILRDSVQNYTLWSDMLDYDSRENSVRFDSWGRMRSGNNELESERGIYLADQNRSLLTGEVRFQGEELRSFSDSLEYLRNSDMLFLWGNIRSFRLEQVGICDRAWYNLTTRESELSGNVAFRDRGIHFFAQRLNIDANKRTVEAFEQVLLEDSLRQDRIYSQHIFYWREPQRVIADKLPLLYKVDSTATKQDTLYMRAEKFDVKAEPRNSCREGREIQDTVYHIWATERVRSYREDFQIAADTIYYNGRDSLFTLNGKPYPYVWNGNAQISAVQITGYIHNKNLDSMLFADKVFLGMLDQGDYYNQMTALQMRAYLKNSELEQIIMEEEGDVIFYMREEKDLIGINRIKSPRYKILMKDRQATDATFYTTTESVMLPIADTQKEDRTLYGFQWRDDLRPKTPRDIIPVWLENINFHAQLRERIDEHYLQEGGAKRKMQWRHEI